MIGDSAAMRLLRQRIAQVAPTDETVLITGESGTGKELVARCLHAASRRSGRALVGLNCPALSPQLMESELFGHERGAFTSADAPRVGRFELAEGGTILLDEITEIDLPLQAKLLRVLQERSYERVGASESRRADVRVVATTNRDLRAEVAAGRFRQDLYFRLAVVPIAVPPLRERLEDVPLLVEHFAEAAATRLGRPAVRAGRRRARSALPLSLAGQCSRAGKPGHAGQRAGRRPSSHRRRSAAVADRSHGPLLARQRRRRSDRIGRRRSPSARGWKTWSAG